MSTTPYPTYQEKLTYETGNYSMILHCIQTESKHIGEDKSKLLASEMNQLSLEPKQERSFRDRLGKEDIVTLGSLV